jgi:hypothetical protein
MHRPRDITRRTFLATTATTAGAAVAAVAANRASAEPAQPADIVARIIDPDIQAGVRAAIDKNLNTAATQLQYPGHFTISADGSAYGADSTWPGLDSWQMAGAYLLLGRTQMVLDYFEFVRASQRKDGNIPFAIFIGTTKNDGTWLRGLKTPEDLFSYVPPKRPDLPATSQATRQWIGLFDHWQPRANPLRTLGAVSYILTAAEIYDATRSAPWLAQRLPSLESAAKYLLGCKTDNGLIGGSGFYTELPPRYGWDGVTQCYVTHAFRQLARLLGPAGQTWSTHADALTEKFIAAFWRDDHFAEYLHAERGLVDSHGLSDVNWAAVAFGLTTPTHLKSLWPRLMKAEGFWPGDIPTQSVTQPHAYETWEYHEKLPFAAPPLKDVAAMGRVWYLEAQACLRIGETQRLIDSTRRVCRAAKDGYWFERYQVQPKGHVIAAGAAKYCEYPAVLVRTVLGNPKVFCR